MAEHHVHYEEISIEDLVLLMRIARFLRLARTCSRNIPYGKTMCGVPYEMLVSKSGGFINANTDIKSVRQGAKMINTLVSTVRDIPEKMHWYKEWLKESDPITPHVTWHADFSAEQVRHWVRKRYAVVLTDQVMDERMGQGVRYWNECRGRLQGVKLPTKTLRLGPKLFLKLEEYHLSIQYENYIWTRPAPRVQIEPCPNPWPENKYRLTTWGQKTIVSFLDGGGETIWMSCSSMLKKWLDLLPDTDNDPGEWVDPEPCPGVVSRCSIRPLGDLGSRSLYERLSMDRGWDESAQRFFQEVQREPCPMGCTGHPACAPGTLCEGCYR